MRRSYDWNVLFGKDSNFKTFFSISPAKPFTAFVMVIIEQNKNKRNVVDEIGGQHTCHLPRMLIC